MSKKEYIEKLKNMMEEMEKTMGKTPEGSMKHECAHAAYLALEFALANALLIKDI